MQEGFFSPIGFGLGRDRFRGGHLLVPLFLLFRGLTPALMICLKKSLKDSPSECSSYPFYSEVHMSQATTLKPGQIRHLLRVTETTSRHPERDCLVLLLGLSCGMRVSEIAQIQIQDLMYSSGVLRTEVSLRAVITKGCRQRCIYLTNRKTLEALQRYLALRIALGLGTELTNDKYRGLSPSTCLVLTHKGSKFYLNTKRRTNFEGKTVDYLACDSLQAHVTKLYKDAGIKQGSSHSGRRSFASNLLHNGASLDLIRQLLGHSEIDHLIPYLEVDQRTLREMYSVVI